MGKNENQFGKNNEWCTPREVWEPIVETFGEIALDSCGHPNQSVPANTVHLLDRYWLGTEMPMAGDTKYIRVGENFDAPWGSDGLVFVNGPWSHCDKTTEKVFKDCTESIQLLPVRTSSVYWELYVWPSPYICFWYGRMQFEGAKYIAPFHNALVYNGPRPELFKEAFRGKGRFVKNF